MKMDKRADQVFTAVDAKYYETMDRYAYDKKDFHGPVAGMIGPDWKILRHGVWLHCSLDSSKLPAQGWKIHLSARRKDADEILKRTAEALIPRKVPFKFLLDKTVLTMTTSKSWNRGGAGKFITVYPSGEKEFRDLLEVLGKATAEFNGPYILSDRRYKEYKVVFYRYGGIKLRARLEADGQITPVLVSPSGEQVPDVRTPYFNLPSWVKDISETEKSGGEGLNNGRYKIESSLGFSNSGGVYLGVDGQSGRKVVVKEARPWINETAQDQDMVSLLNKEYRVLERIKDLGIAPAPLELFKEWEHTFLVQEYLDKYISLAKWGVKNNIVLHTRFTRGEAKAFFLKFIRIFEQLAEIIEKLHGRGVIFGDFSSNNVMVEPDSLDVKLIDFEGAQEKGAARTERFFTPGFADSSRLHGSELSFEDDYYAFGANMHFALFRVTMLSGLNPEICDKWLDCLVSDFGFPEEVRIAINGLMNPDPAARKKPVETIQALKAAIEAMPEGRELVQLRLERKEPGYYREYVSGIVKHIEAAADYGRQDRLWPSIPAMFKTNPLNVAYGAAGILKALNAAAPEKISREMLDWVLGKDTNAAGYPPGLSAGLSGIAWTLLDLGLKQEASALFEKTVTHPLLNSAPDMANGLAGWGMANLRFWRGTGEKKYLDRAVESGKKLVAWATAENGGLCWKTVPGALPVGFAFGAAGISLFLAYLGKAAGDACFTEAAIKALEFDLKHLIVTPDGGYCWPATTAPDEPMLPYVEAGGAGVGMVCLRLWKLTGDKKYLEIVEKIFMDCDRIYTVNPGRDNGLAGLGEFLLDAHKFTGEEKYLAAAHKVAAGIEKFAVKTGEGVAFPGDGLARFSCDYSSGSAGIAAFFHRLESGTGADYLLDWLLEGAK